METNHLEQSDENVFVSAENVESSAADINVFIEWSCIFTFQNMSVLGCENEWRSFTLDSIFLFVIS